MRFRGRQRVLTYFFGIIITLIFVGICLTFVFGKIIYTPRYTNEIICQYEDDKMIAIEFDSNFGHHIYNLEEDNIDLVYSRFYHFNKPTIVRTKTDGTEDTPHTTIYLKNTNRRY